jgi:hypothetical protein
MKCHKHREENPITADFWDTLGLPETEDGGFFLHIKHRCA